MRSEHEERFALYLRALKLDGWEREFRFAPPRRYRFDFALPAQKLAVEIEGGHWIRGRHQRAAGFENDCAKYNLAVLLGWRVLRGTGDMVSDGSLLRYVERALELV